MPLHTPSMAKNEIRKSLFELIDPMPKKKEKTLIWDYFNHECAYCGKSLSKGNRDAHIDHLISATKGGSNHISNLVLSCAKCNGHEKRDMNWVKFLNQKSKNSELFQKRKNTILEWQKHATNEFPINGVDLSPFVEIAYDEIVALYDQKIKEIRSSLPKS